MNTPVNLEIHKLLISKGIDMPVQPTIADVVMVLYKKYDIWIYARPYETDKWYSIVMDIPDNGSKEFVKHISPKEAYEAAIIYTLKNLI